MAQHTGKNAEMVSQSFHPTEAKNSSPKSDFKCSPRSDGKSSSRSHSPSPKKPNGLPHTSGRLFRAFTRRNSLTLPHSSTKVTANQVESKPRKKKGSLPGFDSVSHGITLNSSVQVSKATGCVASNYQRPLPPSPPPAPDTLYSGVPHDDACFPLPEEENSTGATESEGTISAEVAGHSDDKTTTCVCSSNPDPRGVKIDRQIRAEGKFNQKDSVDTPNHEYASQTFPNEAHERSTPLHTQSEYPQVETRGKIDDGQSVQSTAAKSKSSVSLNEALSEYDHKFPLKLKFMEGYCSEDSEHNISANEIYAIHFVKQTRVITLKDSNSFIHRIPLASSMMFGLVYNPNNSFDEALAGHEFEHCSDIMAADIMPRIVCATNQVESPEERQSIAQNEIMIVKGIQKHKLRGKRSLKVFSLLTNSDKSLHEECHGKFTTKPSLIRLHLPQIFECFQKPFPTQAVLYVDRDCPDLSEQLNVPLSGVITLCDCTTETSLVASPVTNDCSDNAQINLHLNDEMRQLEVQVVSWSENGTSHTICSEEDQPSPYVNVVSDLYDDILIPPQNRNTEDATDVYDDVVSEKQKATSDEETYATVGSWKSTASPHLIDRLQKAEQNVNTSTDVHVLDKATLDRYNTIHVHM